MVKNNSWIYGDFRINVKVKFAVLPRRSHESPEVE
jgi:hypothetical protein